MSQKNHTLRWVFFILFGLFTLYAVFFGVTTFADSFRGFEAMQQYRLGGEFNYLSYPVADNALYTYPMSWWAPGQWLVPYTLFCLGITNYQCIQLITILLCTSISLYGFNEVFRRLGFHRQTRRWAMLLILTNQLFYWQFIMFSGGDLLLLAIFPYFTWLLIRVKGYQSLWFGSVCLLLVFLGLLFKNTFLLIWFAGGVFLIHQCFTQRSPQVRINTIIYFLTGILLISVYYYFFMKGGQTPGSATDVEGYQGLPNSYVGDITFAFGSIPASFFRFGFILYKVTSLSHYAGWWMLIPSLIFVSFVYSEWKKPANTSRSILIYFVLPILVAFSIMYLLNRAVSYELRHFAVCVFILTPLFFDWLIGFIRRTFVYVILVGCMSMDMAMGFYSVYKIENEMVWWDGWKINHRDAKIMSALQHWDSVQDEGICLVEDYWFPSFAIHRNAKLVLHPEKSSFFVVSGMELDNPDPFRHAASIHLQYRRILILTRNPKSELLILFPDRTFRLTRKLEGYYFFESSHSPKAVSTARKTSL
jgi:hypothetical protein